MAEGVVSAGDQTDEERRRHTVGGRDLGGVEHAETSAGAGADVEDPTASLHPRQDVVHEGGYGGDHVRDRISDLVVLVIDVREQLERALLLQVIVEGGGLGDVGKVGTHFLIVW